MSAEDNKTLVRRVYEESINRRNLKVIDELIDPNYVDHIPGSPVQGIEGLQQAISTYLTAFPDLQMTIEDLIAEGDEVAARFTIRGTHTGELMGIPPTGRQVTVSALHILRVANGKIVEEWQNSDDLGMMQQLGVIPPLSPESVT